MLQSVMRAGNGRLSHPWRRDNGNYSARGPHYSARGIMHHEGGIMWPEGGVISNWPEDRGVIMTL